MEKKKKNSTMACSFLGAYEKKETQHDRDPQTGHLLFFVVCLYSNDDTICWHTTMVTRSHSRLFNTFLHIHKQTHIYIQMTCKKERKKEKKQQHQFSI